MTKTCLQCGAVLPSGIRVCSFCDSSLTLDVPPQAADLASASQGKPRLQIERIEAETAPVGDADAWRGELANKLQTYRARKRKVAPNLAQSQLPFGQPAPDSSPSTPTIVRAAMKRDSAKVAEAPVALSSTTEISLEAETPAIADDDFSFTIAIGRNAASRDDGRMVIDVSLPPRQEQGFAAAPASAGRTEEGGLYPVASIEERRLAGLIDAGCLLFAYGGFLTLFGSLGGQFTFSKLSAVVCIATFVIVYLQYFALFTVFGGTTPGMMLRGLQVVSFSGEPPTPRQMLWRSLGYMLSAGTFFMGFLWALWDEDALTWHDRLSRTYLNPAPTLADIEGTHAAHSR